MQTFAPISDGELLRAYWQNEDEAAFAELARRHQNIVHAACLRRLGDAALAQDAAQMTFLLMAQKARSLRRHENLAGWLYQTALFQSANLARKEKLRRAAPLLMETAIAAAPAPGEARATEAHLDDALLELQEADREAVVLRYFSGRSLRDVGAAQGTSEEAARKRIGRALERMADFLRGRGVALSSATALASILSAPAQAAPATLLPAVTHSLHTSHLASIALSSSAWWLKAKIAALVALGVAAGAMIAWKASGARERESATLRAERELAAKFKSAPPERELVMVELRGGAIGGARPEPSRLLQLLDALFAAESGKRLTAKVRSIATRLSLSAKQTAAAETALRSAGETQRAALHDLSSGDVRLDHVLAFLRADDAANDAIRENLNDAQRAEFARIIEEGRRDLARDLALWRLADLQLTLSLSEEQKPAVMEALTRSTLSAITELPRPDVSEMKTLLARVDAIGAREHEELHRVLTPEQRLRFEEQANLRRRALDYLLEPEDMKR